MSSRGQRWGAWGLYQRAAGGEPAGPEEPFKQKSFGVFSREEEGEAPEGMRPADAESEIEGSPGVRGAGGSVTGPEAGIVRGEMLEEPGAFERAESQPLTGEEAVAVVDHIMDELGDFKSPEDVETVIQNMAENPDARDWRVITGLQKTVRRRARSDAEPERRRSTAHTARCYL